MHPRPFGVNSRMETFRKSRGERSEQVARRRDSFSGGVFTRENSLPEAAISGDERELVSSREKRAGEARIADVSLPRN